MLTRSRIVASASALAGEPPNCPMPEGIPEFLRYETLADLESAFLTDLNLSPEDRTVSSTTVNLQVDNRDFSLPGSNIETPCYVSVTSSDSPEPWLRARDVEITNLSQLNQNYRERKLAIAFYSDKPRQAKVSWNPTGLETLTIWYDRSPQTDPSPDQATFTIADGYLPLLKLMLGAQMLEMMGRPIGTMLASRIDRGLKQWEKYVKRNRQTGCVEKAQWAPKRARSGAGIWTSEFPIS